MTLLELLVVLVILAVSSGLIAPSIGSSLENLRFRALARQMMAALRQARTLAVSTKMRYEVYFNIETGAFGYRPLDRNDFRGGDDATGEGAAVPRESQQFSQRSSQAGPAASFQGRDEPRQNQAAPGNQGEGGEAAMESPHGLAERRRKLPTGEREIPAGMTLSRGETDQPLALTFYPKGNSTGGTIKLESARGRTLLISVDQLTGRVTLRRDEDESP